MNLPDKVGEKIPDREKLLGAYGLTGKEALDGLQNFSTFFGSDSLFGPEYFSVVGALARIGQDAGDEPRLLEEELLDSPRTEETFSIEELRTISLLIKEAASDSSDSSDVA